SGWGRRGGGGRDLVAVDEIALRPVLRQPRGDHLDGQADRHVVRLDVRELGRHEDALVEPHQRDHVRSAETSRGLRDLGVRENGAAPREPMRLEHTATAAPAEGARRELHGLAGGAALAFEAIVRRPEAVIPGQVHQEASRTWVTATEPWPPIDCASARFAPAIWFAPASPRSWSAASPTW